MPFTPASKGRVAGGRQGTRVLVVGCGFIGSHVVTELASRDRPPVVLTRTRPADSVVGALVPGDLHLGDAGEESELRPLLDRVGDVVYCAGGLLPAGSEDDPERDALLTLGPLRGVLAALRSQPGIGLTYVSSGGTVYGEPARLPVSESAPTRPHGSYGKLHLACEEEIERHRREHGLRARIVRCSTVYGEHQRPDRGQGAVVTFLHRIARGLPIDLYGGGSTVRDYVYAGDVARAMVALLECDDDASPVNLGSGAGTSLLKLLGLIEAQLGRKADVRQHEERGFDVHEIVLDTARLRSLVSFTPTPLERGIELTHEWLAAHESGDASPQAELRSAR